MLTRVDEPSVSGIHGVEWDAVELPSQFMENFAWEWEVLQLLTEHVDTGAKLPRALFDKMIAARNFQSGFYTMRQLEFALFDMLLHAGPPPLTDGEVLALLNAVRREVAVLMPPEYNRFPHAFSHIFAGGYAAGYYSIKNMGTVGGNLCHASPAADSAPPLLVLEATLKFVRRDGEKTVGLEDFFLDPKNHPFTQGFAR